MTDLFIRLALIAGAYWQANRLIEAWSVGVRAGIKVRYAAAIALIDCCAYEARASKVTNSAP